MTDSAAGTERFWLRPMRLEDVPRIASWFEDLDDLASFHRRLPLPVSAAALEATWRESLLAPEPRSSYWFVVDDDARCAVGLAGIEDISYTHGDAVAPLFLVPAVRGKGLGVRARALVLDLIFDQLRLTRVTSFHRADNLASRRLNEACGLREEGRIRHGWFAGGAHIDLVVFGILAEEWREHRPRLRQKLAGKTAIALGSQPSGRWSWAAAPGSA
jgi:RimJ/RimL family protein N-acetyltransferase